MSADRPAGSGHELGIAHLTLLDVAPPELVTLAGAAGFDAVGIRVAAAGADEEPWPMRPGSTMLAETVSRLDTAGVRVLDVEVLQLGPHTGRDVYEPILEAGAALGARFLNVLGADPDLERLAEAFATLTADALPYGIRPLIEPIPVRTVRTLPEAVRIAERSGGGGVEIDPLHLRRFGAEPAELRAVDPALLPLLQLCDAPLTAPTGLPRPDRMPRGQRVDVDDLTFESRAARLLPGEGELPLAELIAAMPAGVPVSVEAPVLALRATLAPEAIARRAREAAASVLAAAAALSPGDGRRP